MILTDNFVFLHLHKSGGSFVNEFLLTHIPGARQVGYHLPRALIPPSHDRLPIVGFTRSPWSYYVSWYAFQQRRPQPNALYRILSDGGRLDFEATIGNLIDLSEREDQLQALVDALPATYTDRGLNLPGPVLANIQGTGRGFFSFLYRHIFGAPEGRRYIGRMELLRETLLLTLENLGERTTPAMRQFVERAPARNVSEHGSYRDYYSDALRERVARRDAEIIAAHGYRFGD
jgi:hypothetical protein